MNSFGRVIAIIIAVILLFIYPLKYLAMNQEEIINNYVQQETKRFTEEIMLKGYLNQEMYSEYIDVISNSNQLYDVDFVHSKLVAGIETSEENTDQGSNLSLSSSSKKSLSFLGNSMSDKAEIKSLSTHVHTNDCYEGHRHDDTCVRAGDMTKQMIITWYNYVSSYANYAPENNRNFHLTCNTCKNTVMMWQTTTASFGSSSRGLLTSYLQVKVYNDKGDTTYKTINMSSAYTLMDTVFLNTNSLLESKCNELLSKVNRLGYTSNYNGNYTVYTSYPFTWNLGDYIGMSSPYSTTTGSQAISFPFIGCVDCGKDKPLSSSCGQAEDITADCDKVVKGIVASKPVQTVDKGSNIDTTVIATYLDGSTKVVSCTSDFSENLIGKQTVTLTYTGLVDTAKKQGTKTTITTVTVELNRLPKSLTVTPSSTTVFNGREPTYTITVHYDDNTSAVLTTGLTKTGFTKGAGQKNVVFTYIENGVTVRTTINIQVQRNKVTCVNNHTYELDDYDNDNGCPTCKTTIDSIQASPTTVRVIKGGSLNIIVTAIYQDGHKVIVTNGWVSNFKPEQIGYQVATVTYEGKKASVEVTIVNQLQCIICGLIYEGNEDGSDPGCPVCSNQLVSIEATPEVQTLQMGELLSLSVLATYRNGSIGEVFDWYSDYDRNKIGKQTVTVYYKSVVTKVTINVESESQVTCQICGTTYNPQVYPRGCPVCYNSIDYIEAYLRSESNQVQLGSELSIYITIVYQDGHRSVDYKNWTVEEYHPQQLGYQTVIVHYKGYATTLDIEVINSLSKTVCSNGHVYYLNADGIDPGCPYCLLNTDTESATIYLDVIYTEQILKELFLNGIYYFQQGDYITISISVQNITIYEKLQDILLVKTYIPKEYQYGGMIRSEKF